MISTIGERIEQCAQPGREADHGLVVEGCACAVDPESAMLAHGIQQPGRDVAGQIRRIVEGNRAEVETAGSET